MIMSTDPLVRVTCTPGEAAQLSADGFDIGRSEPGQWVEVVTDAPALG
jgi:hypothetical protein